MKKGGGLIRGSTLALKFANANKVASISEFLTEYARCVKLFAASFWELAKKGNLPPMPGTELCKLPSWLTTRALQCAAKQAAGICRGAHAKNLRRIGMAKKLWKKGERAQSKKLLDIAHKARVGVPEIMNVEAQLDSRFFALEKSLSKRWDYWLVLKSFDGRKRNTKITVPLKSTKHWRRLSQGKLLSSLLLNTSLAAFAFELPKIATSEGTTLGIDIGLKSTLSASNGVQHRKGTHGHSLESVNAKLCRRKKGSKGFKRAQAHRDNLIRESINKLNFSGVGTLRIERIHDMKRGKRVSRKLSHWSSRDILAALENRATLLGVQVEWVNPRWTSQRCSGCGWVQKRNRQGEQFGCRHCGNVMNADLNAALNISSYLPDLPGTAVRERWNLKGFFWNPGEVVSAAHQNVVVNEANFHAIVGEAQKPNKIGTMTNSATSPK